MRTKQFFPWLKGKLGRPRARKKPGADPAMLWLKKRRMPSLAAQEIGPRYPHRMMGCPIAPVQLQMQTVWFNLVHEYLKTKRKAVHDDTCNP